MAVPISEVATLADVKRQAIYKAIRTGRLTGVTMLGKQGVKEDRKLTDFLALHSNGGKSKERNGKR